MNPPNRRADLNGQVKTGETGVMDHAVRSYGDEIPSEYRPVFDRLHRLITGGQKSETADRHGQRPYGPLPACLPPPDRPEPPDQHAPRNISQRCLRTILITTGRT